MLIKMNVVLLSFIFGTKGMFFLIPSTWSTQNQSVIGVKHIMKGAIRGVISDNDNKEATNIIVVETNPRLCILEPITILTC
jgi:hypothetical protein